MELKIKVTGSDSSHASQIISAISDIIDAIESRDPQVALKMSFSFEETVPLMRNEESTPFTRYINSPTFSGDK